MSYWVCASIALAVAGCASQSDRNARITKPRAAAEAGVLSAAIDAVVDSTHASTVLVVNNRVIPFVDTVALANKGPLWSDFVRHLSEFGPLPGLSSHHYFQMIGPDLRIQSPVTDTAVIALSAVGLSPSNDEAVVYVDHSCGGRCGSTAMYLFRRRGDDWILVERQIRSMR